MPCIFYKMPYVFRSMHELIQKSQKIQDTSALKITPQKTDLFVFKFSFSLFFVSPYYFILRCLFSKETIL